MRRILSACGLRLLPDLTAGYALSGHADWPVYDQRLLGLWRDIEDVDAMLRDMAGVNRKQSKREMAWAR